MFKLIGRLIKLCIFLLIVAAIFHHWTAKVALETVLQFALGTPVKVDNAHLDFLETQVSFEGIEIGNPSGFPQGALARIPKILIDFEIASLWERRVHFETVEIDFEELHVVRASDGRFNLLSLKALQKDSGKAKDREAARSRQEKQILIPVEIDQLTLTLGQSTYRDLTGPASAQRRFNLRVDHAIYRNINGLEDIVRIVSWEALKRMGIGGISHVLGSLKPDLGGSEGLLEKTIAAIREKF